MYNPVPEHSKCSKIIAIVIIVVLSSFLSQQNVGSVLEYSSRLPLSRGSLSLYLGAFTYYTDQYAHKNVSYSQPITCQSTYPDMLPVTEKSYKVYKFKCQLNSSKLLQKGIIFTDLTAICKSSLSKLSNLSLFQIRLSKGICIWRHVEAK